MCLFVYLCREAVMNYYLNKHINKVSPLRSFSITGKSSMNPESIYIENTFKKYTPFIQKLNENGNQQPKKTEAGKNEPK
ncbi:MAG: hypothetical protein HN601_09680 [Candidatus Marinimicrobia bacterium]|jgi:hypothetical protein|nr:hypothetical protein [Candidatus Neomarinimicrobiota bacterium]